jgi:hypothetical protein
MLYVDVKFKDDVVADLTPSTCLYLYLEDVSRADAAALPVAKLSTLIHKKIRAGDRVTLKLSIPDLTPTAHYALRAHLSIDGDEIIAPEDYLTTQSFPLLTQGASTSPRLMMSPAA